MTRGDDPHGKGETDEAEVKARLLAPPEQKEGSMAKAHEPQSPKAGSV